MSNIMNRKRQGDHFKGSADSHEDLTPGHWYNITTAPKGSFTEVTVGGKTLNSG